MGPIDNHLFDLLLIYYGHDLIPYCFTSITYRYFFLENDTSVSTWPRYLTILQSSSRFLQVGLQGYGQSILRETSLS